MRPTPPPAVPVCACGKQADYKVTRRTGTWRGKRWGILHIPEHLTGAKYCVTCAEMLAATRNWDAEHGR